LDMPPLLRALLPGFASLVFAALIATSLWSGSTAAPGRTSRILGERYSAASEPSQFWFLQTLYLAGVIGFGYMAWREFRR